MNQHTPKRIVIVSHYYPPHLGGIEIVAKNQAELLASVGYDVTVVTSKVSANEQEYSKKNLLITRVNSWNLFERMGVPFPIFSPRLLFVLLKHIKNTDVVHIHDAFYISSIVATYCAWHYKKPLVLTQHVEMVNHPSSFVMLVQRIVYATTGALIFHLSSKIITLNDRVERFLTSRGVDGAKLVELSNGTDLSLFHPINPDKKIELRKKYGLSPDKKIVLFVGRFVPKKGFDKLLAAQSEEYQIVFVGGGVPGESNDKVVFRGKLSQAQVAEMYQAADIFALPSDGEGFPLSVQEAMASGLPIITTNDEAYGRYNFDKRYITLLDNSASETLRETISEIIRDDVRRQEMAQYSKQYAEDNFSWDTFLSKLTNLYDVLTI